MGTLSLRDSSAIGIKVVRPAADLFDGTTTSIFTVSGGNIRLTGLLIEVSAGALDATANNVKITSNPPTGTSFDLCAVLDVASNEEGSLYGITGTFTDALITGLAGGTVDILLPLTIPPGTIDLASSGDSNNGNSALQEVTIFYKPIGDGATVVAA